MAKTAAAAATSTDEAVAELRHPKEIAAAWRALREDSTAHGRPRDAVAAAALLDEFIESVAASYDE